MSYSDSDDKSLPGECSWCHDDRGLCDRPHLDEDRRFSIKLEETFDVEMVPLQKKDISVTFWAERKSFLSYL